LPPTEFAVSIRQPLSQDFTDAEEDVHSSGNQERPTEFAVSIRQPLSQDTASELRIATEAVKELEALFDASRGACASLRIAKSSELPAAELAVKLKLVLDLVED
jgi:hypothetical protein